MSADNTIRELLCKYFKNHLFLNSDSSNQGDSLKKFAQGQRLECPSFDYQKNMSELWAMVMERIIEPVWEGFPVYLQKFKLTEYGRKLLEGLPIDRPDQYIDYLEAQVKNIDDQVIVYVRESLKSYNLGCYFASSVMLGVASERLFEILLDAYINAIGDPNDRKKFEQEISSMAVAAKHKKFMNESLQKLTGKQGLTGKDDSEGRRIRNEFENAIKITFDTIRSYRNYASHPHDGMVPRHIIMCNLNAFPIFCERLYNVIEWLIKHNGI